MKPFFSSQRKKFGNVLNPTLMWGQVPEIYLGFAVMYKGLTRRQSPLKPVLRTLVTLRVAQLNRCAFCVDYNAALFEEAGGENTKLALLEQWRSSGVFDEQEKAALDYAESMTDLMIGGVSDDTFDSLKKNFSEHAVIELTALIAFQNMSAKFNAALGVESMGIQGKIRKGMASTK
jgi:AhpD family alkylhydroperoxidase